MLRRHNHYIYQYVQVMAPRLPQNILRIFDLLFLFRCLNDFSARNVQLDEMKKTGFGPCKAKDFASAISNVVVTADEVLPVIDSLKTRVIINNKVVAEGQMNGFYHSLGKAVAYASKGERVYAGEFIR